ncbi:MAG: Eco57I restriction-modification methylase domain-containing protein [Beijerinckiaceae bacterium]
MADTVFQGSLFSNDFLRESIVRLPDWAGLDDSALATLRTDLRLIFSPFPTEQRPNESQTEDDLIWPILSRLGWAQSLRQQNLAARGRDDVPDGLLFESEDAKTRANAFAEEWKRYGFGTAIVESKRWQRPLDRQSGRRGEETAPSTQMLRYLRRVEDLTTGKLRWGILTNGARWRLYYEGARSVSEQFFEIDLAAVLAIPGHDGGLFALTDEDARHWLKVFALVFRREAFLPTPSDPRTFHQRAIDEGRFYEERVAGNLSNLVFGQVFPELAKSIAHAEPAAPLQEVREAALILLYRLLFILYAEDRDLLPVGDPRYHAYGLRDKVRGDIGQKKDRNDIFSQTAARYWSVLDDLFRAINDGDRSIGLPPYNGGLFDPQRTPLLTQIRLGDAVMASVIDALSFERSPDGRKYINYRDLSVQQLGSIYERLLEHEVTREGDEIVIRPNVFARKGSGSYYTPDDLVGLIVGETVDPLVDARMGAFASKAKELESSNSRQELRLDILKGLDPAEKLLELKICDPAMGSGHFLVSLVDYLADRVITAMAEAQAEVPFGDYVSPLIARIAAIRTTILRNAGERGWTIDHEQLDDRHIVRRMVLKRCIYGVDKNLMAVELAKVSLWLHTFTVGAPLSFLDHHLRRGDSLFGSWVRGGIDKASALGAPLFLHESMTKAMRAAKSMQIIEGLTDAEIAEAHRSKDIFDEVLDMTAPLDAILSLIHALDWLDLKSKDDKVALQAFFTGQFGDPVQIALGKKEITNGRPEAVRFAEILGQARELIDEEHFLNWQVAFPGVWSNWESAALAGGFDAVIGNPPWDRMKLQQVEWFAARRREIAMAQRASDRQRMIAALERAEDPLAQDFAKASERAEAAFRVARTSGDYPLLSGGDLNIYSLFVERAMTLVKSSGMVGLLTPSGIASDKTAAPFFKSVATGGRLKALYDFENRRTRFEAPPFFPDVDSRFKFCAFVASPSPVNCPTQCAFFLQDVSELKDQERCFPLSASDFARVNPNTGTAPIFRTRRDAALTTAIYGRLPVLADHSTGAEVKTWPVKYLRMFDMTNDSHLFRTRQELAEKEGAFPIGGNRFRSSGGDWLPLYEGKMVQAFDHRAASVVVNPENQHRPAQPLPTSDDQHRNPDWLPDPQFWVKATECGWMNGEGWVLGFKDITSPTNIRTFISALFPTVGFGNKVPILKPDADGRREWLLAANLNAIVFDFVTRQKIQGQTLNLFIIEQLPVVQPKRYEAVRFGKKTAAKIIRDAVLELTYTAHDMAPFARDMGYVDRAGKVKPPFVWNEERRLKLRAKLDAIYFHLYGVVDVFSRDQKLIAQGRDDVCYIYSTFPIVERDEMEAYGRFRSRDLCLAYLNALIAGDPDAKIDL